MKEFNISVQFNPESTSYGQIRAQFESEFERQFVEFMLDRHAGNLSAAAREAKMDRKHLHDLATKHDLRQKRPSGKFRR